MGKFMVTGPWNSPNPALINKGTHRCAAGDAGELRPVSATDR
jgi:hypothetical protein